MNHITKQQNILRFFFQRGSIPTIIQGITGRAGRTHAELMHNYGSQIVGGVGSVSGGSQRVANKFPVFTSCQEAVKQTGAIASIILVRAFDVRQAVQEAIDAGILFIVCVTEGVPVHDAVHINYIVKQAGAQLIGSSTPGIAIPGLCKLGFIPDVSLNPGSIGVMAKSGTLSYEVNYRLAQLGQGQSVWVGVGGDAVKGIRFADLLPYFLEDDNTSHIVLIGEIGGSEEEEFALAFAKSTRSKPTYALIAGKNVLQGQVMGHAGAVIQGKLGTYESKVTALQDAGVDVSASINELVQKLSLL